VAAATAALATVFTLTGGTNAAPATGILDIESKESLGSMPRAASSGLPTIDRGICMRPHRLVPWMKPGLIATPACNSTPGQTGASHIVASIKHFLWFTNLCKAHPSTVNVLHTFDHPSMQR
jgi:hypothetical protein